MAQVKMYSKVPCPYCVNAKRLLVDKGIPFEEIDLTNDPEQMEELKNKTGWRTFPMIFFDDKLIGGYQDLRALDEADQLEDLLEHTKN